MGHPAINMLRTWVLAFAMFFLMPFKLESRELSTYGLIVLIIFILVFCIAAFVRTPLRQQSERKISHSYDFKSLDILLCAVAAVAVISLAIDFQGKDLSDLAAAYQERSDRADAVLQGQTSVSSIWFKIGFLAYPAGNIMIVREVAFAAKVNFLKLIGAGFLPVLMATLALGGRAPLFYALLLAVIAFKFRRETFPKTVAIVATQNNRLALPIVFVGAAITMTIYFANIFFVRAGNVGSDLALFDNARDNWGVSFNGFGSDLFFNVFGAANTYLIFVFIWYLVQGIVTSNVLFSQYDGGLQYGIYGLDLGSAVARRIDPEFVVTKFHSLLQLNTYGFLPSAFGSLYVDFWLFGLLICGLWGWWAGMVYARFKSGHDQRWVLVAPFASLGVFFSLINTPLGFSNGLVTHIWLFIAFKLIQRRQRTAATA